jgi:hypothetical protein
VFSFVFELQVSDDELVAHLIVACKLGCVQVGDELYLDRVVVGIEWF